MKEILVQWSILILQVVIVGITLGYIKKFSCTLLARIGKYKVNGISSFIGTPIHEFGHYIMAKIFGFKVYNTKFFPITLISLIKPAIKYITYALEITSSIVSGILAICFICQIIYLIIAFIRYNLKI